MQYFVCDGLFDRLFSLIIVAILYNSFELIFSFDIEDITLVELLLFFNKQPILQPKIFIESV